MTEDEIDLLDDQKYGKPSPHMYRGYEYDPSEQEKEPRNLSSQIPMEEKLKDPTFK